MASLVGGWFGRNSVGGLLTSTVSVFELRTTGNSGTRQRLVSLSNHPFKMESLDTATLVLEASYMLTSLLSKTVMYPAVANFAVLSSELLPMAGTIWTSLAGWRTL